MKHLTAYWSRGIVMAILFFTYSELNATTYFFSSSSGDDNRSNQEAQKRNTPWKSIDKLNSIFATLHAGDSILFKSGDVFFGTINVNASGTQPAPIVIASYETGKQPVISGYSQLVNWTGVGNGIWEAMVSPAPSMIHSVLVNNSPQAIARYPNVGAANSGYLTVSDVPSSNSITGTSLPGGDWSNADIVIRKNHWVLDRNPVTIISGNTIQYQSESDYGASRNYGFFMQNCAAAADQSCEWYYHASSQKIGMYFGGAGPANYTVQVSTQEQLLTAYNQNYVTLAGIAFQGSNANAIDMQHCNNVSIVNCSVLYSGNTAVHISNCQYMSVDGVTIDYSNNIACDISSTSNLVLKNSIISNTGTIGGSGAGNSGSYEALLLSGDNQQIIGNTITNTGYVPLTFNGDAITIENNFIDGFGTVKDDGGGIYTWNNGSNPPTHSNRLIQNNIVVNGVGAPAGTEDNAALIHGIYMDDNADHVSIKNNTVANCGRYGLYIHNAHDLVIDGNTAFNNQAQLALIHDNIAAQYPVTNLTVTNNINFSKTSTESVAVFQTIDNSLANMGTMDLNYYCRPLDEQSPIRANWNSGNGLYDLSGWQQLSGMDNRSKKTPVTIAPYRIQSLSGSNKYGNGSFLSNINSLYMYAAGNNTVTSWAGNSPLDGGALKIGFSRMAGNNNYGSLIIGVGQLTIGHTYILRYDVYGAASRYMQPYLRKSLSPYNDLSARPLSLVTSSRNHCEVLLTASGSESDASLVFDIPEQVDPIYLDNIQLYDAQVSVTNPDDSIRFFYNKTAIAASYALDGNYIDVKGQSYTGNVSVAPYSSVILIRTGLALLPVSFSALQATKVDATVKLNWSATGATPRTAQQVERSPDGNSFHSIGQPAAANLMNGAAAYTFIDTKPESANYYRIRSQEEDGSVVFSNIASAGFAGLAGSGDLQISPNPAADKLLLTCDMVPFKPATVMLNSISGGLVRSFSMRQPTMYIDVSSLSRGIYIFTIQMADRIISKGFEKE